jgi:hypothetical protein
VAQTYYDILGVAERATDAEIEAAFKSKAREVHPDRVAPGNPYLRKVAAEAFKDLSEAKSVLLDRLERQKYDAGLAYMRGSQASSGAPSPHPPPQASPRPKPAPQPPSQPSPAPTPAPQRAQKYSFWKPTKTKFGTSVLAAGALGCILLLVGIARTDETTFLGLTLVCLALALLCWRHGQRPSTDAAFLGGSVFLFIFTAIFFGAWLQPPSPVSSKPPAPSTKALTNQVAPVSSPSTAPCSATESKTCAGSEPAPQTPDKTRATRKAELSRPKRPPKGDPILAAISGSSDHTPNLSEGGSAVSSNLQRRSEVPPKDVTKSWKNLRDGQNYRTHSNGDVLYLESADDYLKRVGDITRCEFRRAVSPGLSWTGFCWERNPKDQSSYQSTATLAIFSDARIEGSTSYIPKFVMVPIERAAASASENTNTIEKPAQTSPKSETVPFPEKRGALQLATRPRRPDVSTLTDPERQSIESACSGDKYVNGPAAYNRCLESQLTLLGAAPQRPDLSSLSSSERQSIESACSGDKYVNGPAAYNRCLESQLTLLGAAPQRPDLSSLSSPERQSIEFYKGRSQEKTHLLRLEFFLLRSPLN